MKFFALVLISALSSTGFAKLSEPGKSPVNVCQAKAVAKAKSELLKANYKNPEIFDILQTQSAVIITFSIPSLIGPRNPAGVVDVTLGTTRPVDGNCETNGWIQMAEFDTNG